MPFILNNEVSITQRPENRQTPMSNGVNLPLRVLMVHNKYRLRGGEEVSTEAEVALLRKYGHSVHLITKDNREIGPRNQISLAMDTVWSRESRREIRDILRDERIDIMHVQNFLPQFSPSIYYAARQEGVPLIQTLRNYRLLCPKGTLHRNGKPCEKCVGRPLAWPGIRHACYRDSRSATTVVTAMNAIHGAMGTWTECVSKYIALTRFARDKMIQGGLPAEKIVVKPNFVFPDPGFEPSKENFAIYVGRLSPEKGITTLIRAWRRIDLPLKIVGEGPLRSDVEAAADRLHNVEYLGRKPVDETYDLMGKARLLVFPSEWYETFGRVLIEAFSRGTPVVASRLGVIPEIVHNGRTGLLFTPGDADDLVAKVESMTSQNETTSQMGRHARLAFENKYSARENYSQIIEIYKNAIKLKRES